MKIVVTGGRDFDDRRWLWDGLNLLHVTVGGITELIEGGANGADRLAHAWCTQMNDSAGIEIIKHTQVNAEWEKHGRSAGYIRNAAMADLKPNIVLAAPGGKGTASMIGIAQRRGIKVVMLEKMPVLPSKRGAKSPPEIFIDAR